MRPRHFLLSLARGLAALLPLSAAAPRLRAQQVVAGPGRVSTAVGARLVIPVRLLLAEGGERRVVARSDSTVEVEVPLRAAANLYWLVTVRRPSGNPMPDRISVQREDGSWVDLPVDADVAVSATRPPTNPTPLSIRVRVPLGSQEAVNRLVFGIIRAE